jgi:RNA 2',3'-cyclic 3'-phosphodiesterase
MGPLIAALKIPKSVQAHLCRICIGLPNTIWLDPTEFHIILRFIGQVDGSLLLDIIEKLKEFRFQKFEISLEGITFHQSKRERGSVWVGVQINPTLDRLKKEIDDLLKPFTLQKAIRRLSPHIAIGYFDHLAAHRIESYMEANAPFITPSFIIEELMLLSWETTEKRNFYIEQERFPFQVKS